MDKQQPQSPRIAPVSPTRAKEDYSDEVQRLVNLSLLRATLEIESMLDKTSPRELNNIYQQPDPILPVDFKPEPLPLEYDQLIENEDEQKQSMTLIKQELMLAKQKKKSPSPSKTQLHESASLRKHSQPRVNGSQIASLKDLSLPRTLPNAQYEGGNNDYAEYIPITSDKIALKAYSKQHLSRIALGDSSPVQNGEILVPGIAESVRIGGGQMKIRKKFTFFFRNVKDIINASENHLELANLKPSMLQTSKLFKQKQKLRTINNRSKNTISCAEDIESKEVRQAHEKQRKRVLKEQIEIICEQQTEWDGIVSGHLQHHVIREKDHKMAKHINIFEENIDKRIHNIYIEEKQKKQEAMMKLKQEKIKNNDASIVRSKQLGQLSADQHGQKIINTQNDRCISPFSGEVSTTQGQRNRLAEIEQLQKYSSNTNIIDLSPTNTPRQEIARLYKQFEAQQRESSSDDYLGIYSSGVLATRGIDSITTPTAKAVEQFKLPQIDSRFKQQQSILPSNQQTGGKNSIYGEQILKLRPYYYHSRAQSIHHPYQSQTSRLSNGSPDSSSQGTRRKRNTSFKMGNHSFL